MELKNGTILCDLCKGPCDPHLAFLTSEESVAHVCSDCAAAFLKALAQKVEGVSSVSLDTPVLAQNGHAYPVPFTTPPAVAAVTVTEGPVGDSCVCPQPNWIPLAHGQGWQCSICRHRHANPFAEPPRSPADFSKRH